MHTNPLVARVHNECKRIRYELSNFFSCHDRELIRFQFGETPTQFQFRVKFSSTHKSLKFTFSKSHPEQIEVEKVEKTTDIILDIDEINKTVGLVTVLNSDDPHFSAKIFNLFFWGTEKNKERKQEVFRAEGVKLPDWDDDAPAIMSNKVLYYDIIKSYKVETPVDEDGMIDVRLELLWSRPYFITCPEYFLENIRPNRLLIVNWLQRYNVMNFTTAKHHLVFSPEAYQEISLHLLNQRIDNGQETDNEEKSFGRNEGQRHKKYVGHYTQRLSHHRG